MLQSNRDFYIYYTSSVTPKIGMSALRWKQYKAHFNSHGYSMHVTTLLNDVQY